MTHWDPESSTSGPFRVAVCGIHIESSTFSPYVTSTSDFTVVRDGSALEKYRWTAEVKGAQDVKFTPVLHARALPGGVVSRSTYESFVQEILEGLCQESSWDGVYLDIHGAMSVEGLSDAEADFTARVRSAVGQDCVLAASLDLHGNISQPFFSDVDIIASYRTAPHIDAEETRNRAVTALVRSLREGVVPHQVLVSVPILLAGEQTSTEVRPGRDLYRAIPEVIAHRGLDDLSILMGFPWADQARCRGSVVATGPDREQCLQAAEEIANLYWGFRDEFEFVGPTAGFISALRTAQESDQAPFFISDTGDNPGAGGADDATYCLNETLALSLRGELLRPVLMASIHDPEVVEAAVALQEGDTFETVIGGKHDLTTEGVSCTARLLKKVHSRGMPECDVVLLEVGPNLSVVVTSERKQYRLAGDYEEIGRPLEQEDVIIVKIGYLEPDLRAAAADWIMALTPGAVNQDLRTLPYENLRRPLFPLDSDFPWQPTDDLCISPGRRLRD